MVFWVLFRKFLEIERKSGSNQLESLKKAFSKALTTRNHYYKLMRDFKMTPIFYFANRYYTKAHDGAYKGLRLRLFKEIKKKQEARSEINIQQIEKLIENAEKVTPKKAEEIKKIIRRTNRRMRWTAKIMIKDIRGKIEIKKPQSVKENFQEWLLYSVRLYHQSLQSLIEGQREVLRDKKFSLEDNVTVEEKMQKFEDYLKSKIPKFKQKIGSTLRKRSTEEKKEEKNQ